MFYLELFFFFEKFYIVFFLFSFLFYFDKEIFSANSFTDSLLSCPVYFFSVFPSASTKSPSFPTFKMFGKLQEMVMLQKYS